MDGLTDEQVRDLSLPDRRLTALGLRRKTLYRAVLALRAGSTWVRQEWAEPLAVLLTHALIESTAPPYAGPSIDAAVLLADKILEVEP